MIILGLDPGLGTTGWGVIAADGNRLSHIANGQIKTDSAMPLASRLLVLDLALADLILEHQPGGAAVEEVFVNVNPQSTLKLGQARGVVLLAASRSGMDQVHSMVARLLPGAKVAGPDASDALAVAITHAHHLASARRIPRA
jgi:crossover junction endodeoxyribonuclease RuvC